MAIKWISSAWKSNLQAFPSTDRVYIDFRQFRYPPLPGQDLAYTLITSGDNQPGSHNLTSGHADYLVGLTDTIIVACRIYPNFDYNDGSDQPVWSWYIDATHRLTLFYQASSDKFVLAWQDGGTERTLESQQFDNGDSYDDINQWLDIYCVLDLSTGTTAGSALYVNRELKDDEWSGASDTKSSLFPLFSVRHENETEGDYKINYIRCFLDKTVTSVSDDFKSVGEEEIYWHFNGEGTGRTRCNVDDFVLAASIKKNRTHKANSSTIRLNSDSGVFADDQYAAFDPANAVYNGTSAQKYMQHQTPLIIENWYSNLFEPVFVGKVNEDLYRRKSTWDGISTVNIEADDYIADIAKTVKRKGRSYENYKLSDSVTGSSLIHVVTRLATQKEVYNYLSNSSFENATISNSWTVAGASATFSRAAGGLFGSYQGDLVYGSALSSVYQIVTFTDIKKLNVGENWTFSMFLKSADSCSGTLRLSGYDDAVEDEYASENWSLSGGENWEMVEVTLTIADSTVDRLRATVTLSSNVTLSLDGAMLVQNDCTHNWFVLNDNDGSSGVESADDADYGSYDTVGFDVDYVNVVHPWAVIEQDVSIFEYLKEIADACGATYFGMDSCGTLKLRAMLKTGYSDPTPIETISSVVSVASNLELQQANKIIIHGVYIIKETAIKVVWDAVSSGLFGDGERPRIQLLNTEQWPDPDIYGEFWAQYNEVETTPTETVPTTSKPGARQ